MKIGSLNFDYSPKLVQWSARLDYGDQELVLQITRLPQCYRAKLYMSVQWILLASDQLENSLLYVDDMSVWPKEIDQWVDQLVDEIHSIYGEAYENR